MMSLRKAPGVTAASASLWLPLNHETISEQVAPASLAGSPADEWPLAVQNNVYPAYFETMGIALTAGRDFVLTRTSDDPASVIPGVRNAINSVVPDLPLAIRPMMDVVAENQLQWSLSSLFLGVFGVGALLLATLGIYGLVSFSVSQRKRELGVRIALGATRAEIRKSVVGDGLKLTAIGLAIGMATSMGLGQLISSVLYDVSPFDPVTLGAVLVLFLTVAAVASFIPAARASRTDPIEALRSE